MRGGLGWETGVGVAWKTNGRKRRRFSNRAYSSLFFPRHDRVIDEMDGGRTEMNAIECQPNGVCGIMRSTITNDSHFYFRIFWIRILEKFRLILLLLNHKYFLIL